MTKVNKMEPDKFRQNMKDKVESSWSPTKAHLGEDFAVFEFDYKYERDNAFKTIEKYYKYFGYLIYKNKDKKFTVVNTYV